MADATTWHGFLDFSPPPPVSDACVRPYSWRSEEEAQMGLSFLRQEEERRQTRPRIGQNGQRSAAAETCCAFERVQKMIPSVQLPLVFYWHPMYMTVILSIHNIYLHCLGHLMLHKIWKKSPSFAPALLHE